MGADISRVCHALRKLIKYKYIGFEELDRISPAKYLNIKILRRRMKCYFRINLNHHQAFQGPKTDLR